MPIDTPDVQIELPEVGRIRLGEKGAKGNPQKLETFRLTSPNESLLHQVATQYGGKVREWKGAPEGKQWELYLPTNVLDVLVPFDNEVEQWFESWAQSGCTHRCTGTYDTITQRPCAWRCGAHDKSAQSKAEAKARRDQHGTKLTTRLRVILPDIDAAGTWRVESHGGYAASALASASKVVQQAGISLRGKLILHGESSQRITGRKPDGMPTRQKAQYVVPRITFDNVNAQVDAARQLAIQGELAHWGAIERANVPQALTAGVGRDAEDIYDEYDGPIEAPVRSSAPKSTVSTKPEPQGKVSDEDIEALRNLLLRGENAGMGNAEVLEANILAKAHLTDIRNMGTGRYVPLVQKLQATIVALEAKADEAAEDEVWEAQVVEA